MSRKRSLMPDVYRNKKRLCTGATSISNGTSDPTNKSVCTGTTAKTNGSLDIADKSDKRSVPSATESALLKLHEFFPLEKFEQRIPPIMIKHQVYSLVDNETDVEKDIADLRSSGKIRLFKLGNESDEFRIVFTSDYYDHVCRTVASTNSVNKSIIDKFFTKVISQNKDLSLSKHKMLSEYQFTDDEITQLVKAGVLTVRDIGSWWISIPCAGIYMKSFIRGRKAILMMIRKCKYKEILETDLANRKLPKAARLGMSYHIRDIIGGKLVEVKPTTSGRLLRLSSGS